MGTTRHTLEFVNLPSQIARAVKSPSKNALPEMVYLALIKLSDLELYTNGISTGALTCVHEAEENEDYQSFGQRLLGSLQTIVLEKPIKLPSLFNEYLKSAVGDEAYEELQASFSEHMDDNPTSLLQLWVSNEVFRAELPLEAASPEANEALTRAIRRLWYALAHFEGIVTAIATRPLSCDHETLYAGGVESEGNRIYTPVKMIEQLAHIAEAFEQVDAMAPQG